MTGKILDTFNPAQRAWIRTLCIGVFFIGVAFGIFLQIAIFALTGGN